MLISTRIPTLRSFLGGSVVKNLPANAGDVKFPWKREWQPTPVSLPGEFHGQRSLEGYSSWGRVESDTIERLNNNRWSSHCTVILIHQGSMFLTVCGTRRDTQEWPQFLGSFIFRSAAGFFSECWLC